MDALNLHLSLYPHRRKRSPKNYNRIRAILKLVHSSGMGNERDLARASGISATQISRIIHGTCTPTFSVMAALTRALEIHLGCDVDPRDILNFDGAYPTAALDHLLAARQPTSGQGADGATITVMPCEPA